MCHRNIAAAIIQYLRVFVCAQRQVEWKRQHIIASHRIAAHTVFAAAICVISVQVALLHDVCSIRLTTIRMCWQPL